MIFSWLKNRRRRKLAQQPLPDQWAPWLEALPFYTTLTDEERARLQGILRILIAEKKWTGGEEYPVTEEMRVVISAQAALLILEIEHEYFRRVKEIIVRPRAYQAGHSHRAASGVVSEGMRNSGEAWYRGPVILSWDGVRTGADDPKDGHNLVLHEFAHKLDMLDGFVDGTPPLHRRAAYATWTAVMTEEFQKLKDAARRGRRTVLDRYGATNEAEFFAVATETFFEKPRQLHQKHESLYDLLRDYYRQDPLARLRRAAGQ